jgi:ubiquinone biosynthesis protein
MIKPLSIVTSPIKNLKRWREVQVIMVRYGFDILFETQELQEIQKFLRDKVGISLKEPDHRSVQMRARLMLEELGPTYIKLGQILSSRTDLLPGEWIEEFSKLQDEVPPFAYEQVEQVFLEEFEQTPEELFFEFETEPIAAASIGQVHRAKLMDLSDVVVKVQRPGIIDQVTADIEIIKEIANLIEARTQIGKQYGVRLFAKEFTDTIKRELDYTIEANNADRLRRVLAHYPNVHVPFIYKTLSSKRILTMEKIDGVKANDIKAIENAGVDRKKLADTFINSILHQVMIAGFYHADPHPGNVLINLEKQTINYIDLGMMGTLLQDQREQLGEIVSALIERDSREVMRLILILGDPYKPVDEVSFQRDIDRMIGMYLDAALEDFSLAGVLSEVLSLVMKYHIRIPGELSLGFKPLIQGEALAHTLDPEVVIVDIAKSISKQMFLNQFDPKALSLEVFRAAREIKRLIRTLPPNFESIIQQLKQGKLTLVLDIPDIDNYVDELKTIVNRIAVGLILAGMIIGSAIVMGVSTETSPAYVPILGTIGFIIAMVIGGGLGFTVFWSMWRTTRHQRKKSRTKLK